MLIYLAAMSSFLPSSTSSAAYANMPIFLLISLAPTKQPAIRVSEIERNADKLSLIKSKKQDEKKREFEAAKNIKERKTKNGTEPER